MRLAAPPPRRRIGLAPMIDVVFLLLIFFMLAARFGQEGAVALTLAEPGEGAEYAGPPRLVDVGPDSLRLNGVALGEDDLADALMRLVARPDDLIVLRPSDGADVQRIVDVLGLLGAAGLTGGTLLR